MDMIYKIIYDYKQKFNAQEEQSNQEDSDSSEIDEIEPRLKYVRIRNDLEHILQNDAASCIAVHPKVKI